MKKEQRLETRGARNIERENLDGRMVSSPESVCRVFPQLKIKEGIDSLSWLV